jgi:glycosyltransferase involved in cell wall biosynthesis
MKLGIDVTVVVNAHREGLIARPSLLSISRAKAHAEERGLNVEVIVVLDRADSVTMGIVERWEESDVRVLRVDHGDLGLSRNYGVNAAAGEWVAFIDADDLWCETWLNYAVVAARHDRRKIVWHPEVSVYFGVHKHIFMHMDMESDGYDPLSLCQSNYWTSSCFANRAIFVSTPYPRSELACQIGHEDWSWNLSVIGKGAIHKVVKTTGHAIRSKRESLLRDANLAGAFPKPDNLFRKYLFDSQASFQKVKQFGKR